MIQNIFFFKFQLSKIIFIFFSKRTLTKLMNVWLTNKSKAPEKIPEKDKRSAIFIRNLRVALLCTAAVPFWNDGAPLFKTENRRWPAISTYMVGLNLFFHLAQIISFFAKFILKHAWILKRTPIICLFVWIDALPGEGKWASHLGFCLTFSQRRFDMHCFFLPEAKYIS